MKNRIILLLVSVFLISSTMNAQENLLEKAKEDLAYTIGTQAYIYGFTTVELYRTFYQQVIDENKGHSVGVNQFNHVRKLATPEDTWVVTPNNDTYYSKGWLDLSKEPIVLKIPAIKDRFFAFPIGDFYHDANATLGWWNVGYNGGNYALVAPGWQGILPENVERVDVSTPDVPPKKRSNSYIVVKGEKLWAESDLQPNRLSVN